MTNTKGILLAGGSGTRLYPLTQSITKQLLPIYNKPMIYYSLSVLLLSGIKEILIISTKRDIPSIQQHFGNGEKLGIEINYAVQEKPNGIAEAFLIGEKFIEEDPVCLILGDNIFYGHQFSNFLKRAKQRKKGATVFAYKVKDPKAFGVVEFDENKMAKSIEEKPKNPKSNYAVTGLYFYDNQVLNLAKSLTPSARGELEITDLNRLYLQKNQLQVEVLGRGFSWLDTGTFDDLFYASEFVKNIESRQNFKIACLEEIALKNKWISKEKLERNMIDYPNQYSRYIQEIITDE